MPETGTLSQDIKGIVDRNKRELSSVEGNIFSVAGAGKDIKTVLVTSCNASEGKTISAISMAYGLYNETNLKILLVDGNLRTPTLHSLFRVKSEPGLSDFVLNNATNVFKETEFSNLVIMPHGTAISNPLDIYRSKDFKTKLDSLREMFDYVIFDSHSILSASDTSIAARHFDGVVIVVECEKTKWEVLQMASEKIQKLRGNIIGVVMNKRKYYIPRALYGKI
jgi:capsular exopolysaccharide synthesis family protein